MAVFSELSNKIIYTVWNEYLILCYREKIMTNISVEPSNLHTVICMTKDFKAQEIFPVFLGAALSLCICKAHKFLLVNNSIKMFSLVLFRNEIPQRQPRKIHANNRAGRPKQASCQSSFFSWKSGQLKGGGATI